MFLCAFLGTIFSVSQSSLIEFLLRRWGGGARVWPNVCIVRQHRSYLIHGTSGRPPPGIAPPRHAHEKESGRDTKKQPPAGWQEKTCAACDSTPMEPSSVDLAERRGTRKWARRFFWGDLCWWCSRVLATRYAHMTVPQFVAFLEKPQSKQEAKLTCVAYLSLRDEGRTQIPLDALLARIDLFMRLHASLPGIINNVHKHVIPLQELMAMYPSDNPVETGYEIKQMLLNGVKRLCVECPAPLPAAGQPRGRSLDGVRIHPEVHCDSDSDWKLLCTLADAAKRQPRVVASPVKCASASSSGSTRFASPSSSSAMKAETSPSTPAPGMMQDDFDFPGNRLGNAVKKNIAKIAGMLQVLMTDSWRDVMVDVKLRALLRSISGCKEELKKAESPGLMKKNSEALEYINSMMMMMCSAMNALAKSKESRNYARCAEPLSLVASHMADLFGAGRLMDCELLVTQVPLGFSPPQTPTMLTCHDIDQL